MAFAVSDEFKTLVQTSHSVRAKADLYLNSEFLFTLPDIIEGNVVEDREQTQRRTGGLSIVDEDGTLTPTTAADILSPFAGAEILPSRGTVLSDGTIEWVDLGIFRIQLWEGVDSGDSRQLNLTLQDRSCVIQRYKFLNTYVIAKGTTVDIAIGKILHSVNPLWILEYRSGDSFALPSTKTWSANDDRWNAITTLAASIGCEAFFDVTGNLVVQPVPDLRGASANWTFSEKLADVPGTMLSVDRQMQVDDTVYNYVVVTGESSGNSAPVRAVAFDDNPNSPTRISGPFGVSPFFFSSSSIGTVQQAQAAANGLMNKMLGRYEQDDVYVVPNPAVQVDDVVAFTRGASKLVNALAVVDMVSVPLVAARAVEIMAKARPV